jgi:hypothetical protein
MKKLWKRIDDSIEEGRKIEIEFHRRTVESRKNTITAWILLIILIVALYFLR